MLKAIIRKQALKQRLALDKSNYESLNESLLKQFSSLNFVGIKTIHIFLPIIEKNEPNTFLLIDWLKQYHPEIDIIVPKANFEENSMTSHLFTEKQNLRKNAYNILEPNNEVIYTEKIDWVILPLLAFDSRGYRVGYGKGFYDRFLEHINAQKIGLSLLDGIDIINDVHENDVRLDICITPTAIIKF